MDTTPRLYSARQIADETGFSVGSLYERARSGELPHYRLGRTIRFDLDEVKAATRVEGVTPSGPLDELTGAELYEALGLGSAA